MPVGAAGAAFVGLVLDDTGLLEVAVTSPEPDTLGGCELGLVLLGGSRLGRFGM